MVLHELGAFRSLIDRTVMLRGGTIIHESTLSPVENGYDAEELEHDHVHPHEDPTDPAEWLAPELRLEPRQNSSHLSKTHCCGHHWRPPLSVPLPRPSPKRSDAS